MFILLVRWASSKAEEHDDHHEETYEEYTQRYMKFFNEEADDMFELSRGLNNAFCTDIVPAPEVLVAALKAARRLNSFSIAARVVQALREKIQDEKIYKEYLTELEPTLKELGVPTPEELGR
jgi:cytochrome c oxidase subunit 5a